MLSLSSSTSLNYPLHYLMDIFTDTEASGTSWMTLEKYRFSEKDIKDFALMHNAAKKTRQEVYRYTGDHEE